MVRCLHGSMLAWFDACMVPELDCKRETLRPVAYPITIFRNPKRTTMAGIFNFLFSRRAKDQDSVEDPKYKNDDDIDVTNKGYNPRNSTLGSNAFEEFIKAPLSKDLESVPGIGSFNAMLLDEQGVKTPHQLLAIYMSLGGESDDSVELQDKFYYWLQHVGINSNRSTIVEVVAKKVNMWIPGIYDESAYSSENK